MKNSIEVINLSKSYGLKEAVRNISFKINENEIIGLLGPNGCGKTTTMGMLLGLLKPSNGQVLINGKNIETNKISLLHKMNFISPHTISFIIVFWCRTFFSPLYYQVLVLILQKG